MLNGQKVTTYIHLPAEETLWHGHGRQWFVLVGGSLVGVLPLKGRHVGKDLCPATELTEDRGGG